MHSELPSPVMIVQRRAPWWRRPLVWAAALIVMVGLLSAAGVWYMGKWYNHALEARSSDMQGTRITIEKGMDGQAIGKLLEQKKIIRSARAFGKYLKKNKISDLKAGTYLLSPSSSVQEIVSILAEGKVDTFHVTLSPGRELTQIRDSLVKAGFNKDTLTAALNKHYTHPLLADKPASADLEGYILPETYQLTSEETPEQFITTTFDVFYQQLKDQGLIEAIHRQGLNLHQAFTLASIVQQEASNKDDQRKVAQVFQKRLDEGIMLGSDVTFMYASHKAGVADDVNIDSPYNTRRYKGLPPGPIGNFTISTLEAVARPASTDFLFFVAGDDGTVHFSRTQAEHEALTQKYCTKLCQ